jgi:hypothetical protein
MLLDKYLIANVPHEGEGVGTPAAAAPAAAAPAAAAPAAAAPAAAAGAAFYEAWNLDPEHKQFVQDKGFTDPATLVKSAREADRMARERNVIDRPDPKKPQDWKGFSELGYVDDPAKYLAAVEKPQGADEGLFGAFAKAAHGAKIAPWQAKALFASLQAYGDKEIGDLDAAIAGQAKALEAALRQEWPGQKFEVNRDLARRTATALGIGKAESSELEKVIGAPRLVKMMHKLGTMMGEDQLIGGDGGGGFGMSPVQAGVERRKLEGDPNWMKVLNDPAHPQHGDYAAQRMRLIEIEARAPRAA